MIKVGEVVEAMEKWAPQSLAETWDNSGLLTGNTEDNTQAVLIALDVTEDTIRTAQNIGASMIVSHHPPLFKPLLNLSGRSLSCRIVREAIKGNIALYASHTALDQVRNGVSHALAEKLGLLSVSFLTAGKAEMVKFVTFVPPEYTDRIRETAGAAGAGIVGEYRLCSFTAQGTGTYIPSSSAKPFMGMSGGISREAEDRIEMIVPSTEAVHVVEAVRKIHPYEEMAYDLIPLKNVDLSHGYGAVGDIPEPMNTDQFAAHVADLLGVRTLTVSPGKKEKIERVAVLGGSGGSFIANAIDSGADAFVTGDLGHHDFLDNSGLIMLVDASHRATEIPVLKKIMDYLACELKENALFVIDSGKAVPFTKIWNHLIESSPEEKNERRSCEAPGRPGN
jgi:dinuclear metal center YbgI/SA1388 family protein